MGFELAVKRKSATTPPRVEMGREIRGRNIF
jgi:hypothetical protein